MAWLLGSFGFQVRSKLEPIILALRLAKALRDFDAEPQQLRIRLETRHSKILKRRLDKSEDPLRIMSSVKKPAPAGARRFGLRLDVPASPAMRQASRANRSWHGSSRPTLESDLDPMRNRKLIGPEPKK